MGGARLTSCYIERMVSVRTFLGAFVLLATSVAAACAPDTERTEMSEADWDSEDGNPTHATHSIMAEHAVDAVARDLPEVRTFAAAILAGANLELHDKPMKNAEDEALRIAIGGNNWSASHPEILWERARAEYVRGDKAAAYRYVGVMLHYAQDMGVPAHAFHVIHQNKITNWDTFEVLAFFDFHADLKAPPPPDPGLVDPVAYIEWSASEARTHFTTAFPGVTYRRTLFPQGYADLSEDQWAFLRSREAACTFASDYTLNSAARALSTLAR